MDTLGIIRQIEADPALRSQLRAVLLGDELLDVPRLLGELAEGQRRLEESLRETQAVLRAFMASTEARLGSLESDSAVLKTDVAELKTDVAELKGSDLERRVRENPARYLVDHLEHPARIRALTGEALESFFETLSRKSPLEPDELRRLRRTDLLAEARVQGAATRLTIVAEVSATLHVGDVVRAAESAGAVSRRGLRVMAVALGRDLGAPEVGDEAATRGVVLASID